MNKKILTIFVALMLVCVLVFVFAACGENKNDTTDPDNGQTSTDNQGGGQSGANNGTNTGTNSGTSTGTNTGTNSGTGNTSADLVAKYHIYFYTGATATQVETISGVKAGDPITAPADPMLAYNQFDGWYTDYGTYQNKFEFGTMPAGDVCLYAKWTSTVSEGELGEYEQGLVASSQEGHLYIHYRRFDSKAESYEPLNLWVWPYGFTGREFDWNRDASGKVVLDTAGAMCDVDLTKIYNDAGKDGKQELQFLKNAGAYTAGSIKDPANYMDERFGFLIVYKDSKNIEGSHWRSDGNADQLFTVRDAVWDNGSIHIFCVQDNVSDYVFHLSEQEEIVNPYENDDGTHVSYANVNSSETIKVQYGTKIFDTVSGVGYQIMVSSFADSNGDGMGDIRGIIENFDYLKSLHIDALWLTPIQLSDSYHGYDIIDYKQIDPKFGTLADYKELLTLCHQNGMKVIMDLVLNHTSTNNVWFQKSAKMVVEDGIDYRSYYQWRNHTVEKNLSSDWYPYSEYNYSYYGKFSPSMPELNYDYQGTRDAIADVAKYWLGILGDGTGVDGFRIDAVKHIYMADEVDKAPGDIVISDYDQATQTDYSSNLTKNLNFFCWFVNQIKAEYPNAYMVGENFDGNAYNVAPYYEAYDGMLDFYMYYNFGQLSMYPTAAAALSGANSAVDASNSQPKGENTGSLLFGSWCYPGVLDTQERYSQAATGSRDVMGSLFSSNHDIPRLVNNCVRDDLGNGKWQAGTVSASNSGRAQLYAKAVLGAMMTMPGISWIYYGDEIGMSSNYLAGQNAQSPHVDRQYRQPFKWTTKDWDEAGGSRYITHFSISGDETYWVEWDAYNTQLAGVAEQQADPNSYLNYVKYWTDKKSTDDVLRFGSYEFIRAWGNQAAQLLSFKRTYNGTTYWCLTNFGTDNADVSSMVNTGSVKYAQGLSGGSLAGGCTLVIKVN
ncbi:MAG: InlB B-repeat-containing protein [Clostridia bacterium]|nr:InlB B-repeat-containing protein [Clostridia bacterium]